MSAESFYTARRIRSCVANGERAFTLDGRSIGITDLVYVDTGNGWELAYVDRPWDDDPPPLHRSDRLLVRLDSDDEHTLRPVLDSWRIVWPVLLDRDGTEVYTHPAWVGQIGGAS